ncbi:hypothetical protein Pmani_004146 [Petrolisthes manimaculis]|uniref:Uncharacterized protein n=1 Tax=Petrolisthes manimaculis TaxID=1843537 RepID=A0AAE1QFI8_9EUCA|nr:hypothetical protein Pmani_004146 [Petrolisthes manimaculis]
MKTTGISSPTWGLLILAFLSGVRNGVGVCHLENYVSSCILDILEEHIEATAVINHCHLPLDITFLIAYQYKNSTRHTWKYTFVTTNQNERVLIPGLLLPNAPHTPVFLYARVPEAEFNMHNSSFVAIEASFIADLGIDEWEEAEFLNHTVYIPSTSDCGFINQKGYGYDPIPWIIGGLFIIALVTGVLGVGCYYYQRKKLAVDQLALVSAMEVGIPGSQPYQMDAAAEQNIETSETQNGNIPSTENIDNVQDGEHPQSGDCINIGQAKNGKKGFKFERLKEEIANVTGDTSVERDTSVIISNPAFREDNFHFPANQEVRGGVKHAKNYELFHGNKNNVLENGNVNVCFESDDEPEQRASSSRCSTMEESIQNHMPENQEVIDGEQYVDSDDRENNGQQVGQGARRKVKGMTTSVTGPSTSSSSTIIVSEEANNADSHKSL